MDRYVTIFDWMLELGLNGRELNAYAVIYSFGKNGDWFTGSASYLGQWMGVKKKDNVYRALSALMDKGLIEKRERWERGQKLCDYRPAPKRGRGTPEKGVGATPEKGPGPTPKKGFHNNRPDRDRPYSDSDKKEYKEIVQLSLEEFRKSHR